MLETVKLKNIDVFFFYQKVLLRDNMDLYITKKNGAECNR